jgi:hypothetical protein
MAACRVNVAEGHGDRAERVDSLEQLESMVTRGVGDGVGSRHRICRGKQLTRVQHKRIDIFPLFCYSEQRQ